MFVPILRFNLLFKNKNEEKGISINKFLSERDRFCLKFKRLFKKDGTINVCISHVALSLFGGIISIRVSRRKTKQKICSKTFSASFYDSSVCEWKQKANCVLRLPNRTNCEFTAMKIHDVCCSALAHILCALHQLLICAIERIAGRSAVWKRLCCVVVCHFAPAFVTITYGEKQQSSTKLELSSVLLLFRLFCLCCLFAV